MIKINRKECPSSIQISQNGTPKSKGQKETEEAISFYQIKTNRKEKFKKKKKRGEGYTQESYSAYKEDDVRKELVAIFKGKCAYCETEIVAACPGDIEHFRPKGGYNVKDSIVKPGYYWLAADWENLLLACPNCNQTHTYLIFEGDKWIEKVVGKLNQFPLDDESKRLTCESGRLFFNGDYEDLHKEEEEVRLLLKPCTDNVEDYFEYSEEGLIRSKKSLEGIDLKRAKTSILVCALQRSELVKKREQKIIDIKVQVERVIEIIGDLNDEDSRNLVKFEKIKNRLRKELRILKEFMLPEKEFAGLARYFIKKFMQSVDDKWKETE
ncbi:hypothetical protein [Marinifilum fragile]|uniref:hypothetical protein n=1 Tax=Marinifilum fragile TaxID=570161 RepID=UPI002AA8B5C9|nr:hypothetical protein [Marinifilum fragile]